MAEEQWFDSEDPQEILLRLFGLDVNFFGLDVNFLDANLRRFRLFAVACCRSIWPLFTQDAPRRLVEALERYADGEGTEEAWSGLRTEVLEIAETAPPASVVEWVAEAAFRSALAQPEDVFHVAESAATAAVANGKSPQARVQALLLRDIFGNTFRQVRINPCWLSETVVAFARTAYEDRNLPAGTLDVDRLKVLADALEDAGCDNADILEHCRGPGPHVRGCWVVDLILGKS
jgi:hypothetical protein